MNTNASLKWVAGVCAGLAVSFLAFDSILKVCLLGPAVEGSAKLGFTVDSVLAIGIIELVLLVIYLLPRTAVLGAVLWTGYLGGAIATHVRMGDPLFSHTLFPIYVAAMLWFPLFVRDTRVRALVLGDAR